MPDASRAPGEHVSGNLEDLPSDGRVAAAKAFAQYEKTSDLQYLDIAVASLQRSADESSEPDAHLYTELGQYYGTRYHARKRLDDLDRAIAAVRKAIQFDLGGPANEATSMANLGYALRLRSERLGAPEDLEDAITLHQRAIDLVPDNPPYLHAWLHNLGLLHRLRYVRYHDPKDLEHGITVQQRAINLTPAGHSVDESKGLTLLSLLHSLRFQRFNDLEDIDHAIEGLTRALELTPPGNPSEPTRLSNLGSCFRHRFERLGNRSDLERSIAMHLRAVQITSESDPDMPSRLDHLGSVYHLRFMTFGELADLELSIVKRQRVVELTPRGHPEEASRIQNLAGCLRTRFLRLNEINQLERAIALHHRVVELTPEGHPDMPGRLASLGASQSLRFQHSGDVNDIMHALDSQQRAVELSLHDDPQRPSHIKNLAASLHMRFLRLGDLDDLNRAITLQQQAIELTPQDHPSLLSSLNNLGVFFDVRFQRSNDLEDLERGVTLLRRVVQLSSPEHPHDVTVGGLGNLGHILTSYLRVKGTRESSEEASSCYMAVAAQGLMAPFVRQQAAQRAIELHTEFPQFSSPDHLLAAHSRILNIVPELVWLGYSMSRRFEESQKIGDLVSAAVLAAIDASDLSLAIEWLEAGRSSVWSQIHSLRGTLDELEQKHPALARSLKDVQIRIQNSEKDLLRQEAPAIADGSTLLSPDPHTGTDRHRGLAIEHGTLLADIRRQAGFENFMRPKTLSALLPSSALADHGFVVFVNMNKMRCNALILGPKGDVTSIPLPDLSMTKAEILRSKWQLCLRQLDVREHRMAVQQLPRSREDPSTYILGCLWKWIVLPVLQALDLFDAKAHRDLHPHITWCPTGPLTQLPLHAAGIYGEESGPRVYDFVISSYTPSLSALARSLDGSKERHPNPSALIVTQSAAPSLPLLPGATEEGQRLCDIFSDAKAPFSILNDEQATTGAAKCVLSEHPWLHLACHGSQNADDPLKSAFVLHDGPLSLADLMATTADNAELAFLSACQTAVGDVKIPEESMHLAAGMLAVGYKGVIATMWSIRDQDAPLVVEAYYKKLLGLRASGKLGKSGTGAAYALHEAVRGLREEVGEKNVVRWAPFVHFGI
ncbi:unnamed protein product [Peniophora sp. CBMAI 1063]|nr:unnamed protein product [Peniophora sp. CBMAI 1063]